MILEMVQGTEILETVLFRVAGSTGPGTTKRPRYWKWFCFASQDPVEACSQ